MSRAQATAEPLSIDAYREGLRHRLHATSCAVGSCVMRLQGHVRRAEKPRRSQAAIQVSEPTQETGRPAGLRNTESSDSLQEVPVAVHTSGFLLLSQLGASCSTQLMLDFVAAWAFFVLTSFLTSLRGYMLQAMQGVLVEILSTCTHDR